MIERVVLRAPARRGFTLDTTCISCTRPEDDPSTLAVSDHWKLVLHPDQTVPGSLLVVSLRHVPRISELTPDEATEFFLVASALEQAMETGLGASMVNFSCLRNWAFRTLDPIPPMLDGRPNPHVHWHVAPRYASPVTIGDEVFVDPAFGEELTWESRDVSNAEWSELIATLSRSLRIESWKGSGAEDYR